MYADLLEAAEMDDGSLADVVKSTYWLYFDLGDGTEPYIRTPNISNCMPKYQTTVDVYEDPEILRHHPCIWTALYRMDFLKQHDIHMIEPKGAGWADNPWLFDTLLNAKKVVWLPVAHYYYRQTNPNASSNLRDFHLPFDRLRDIRAIYKRMNIDNEGLKVVLYQRSFNYIIDSILGEFDFDESDPKLKALIREVLESMDRELLMSTPNKKLAKRFKDYYADFMGETASQLKKVEKPKNPLISVVLPMKDDREGLWTTLKSLMAQQFENFEVLCYDCSSRDRSAEIIKAVSSRDKRFSLVGGTVESISEALNQGVRDCNASWIYFLRSGTSVDKAAFSTISDAIESGDLNQCQMLSLAKNFYVGFSKNVGFEDAPWLSVSAESQKSILVTSSSLDMSYHVYHRSFIENEKLGFREHGDENGYAFELSALLHATNIGYVRGVAIRNGGQLNLDRKAFSSEEEFIEFEKNRIDALLAAGADSPSDESDICTRIAVAKCLDTARSYIGRYKAREPYFKYLKNTYENVCKVEGSPRTIFGDFAMGLRLEAAFGNTYEELLISGYNSIIRQRDTANRQKNTAIRNLNKVRNSKAYKITNIFGRAVRKVIPKRDEK